MIYGECLKENYIANLLLEQFSKDTKLHPVFITLIFSGTLFSRVARTLMPEDEYWHAGISFEPTLSYIYSYNYAKAEAGLSGGLSFESIDFYKRRHPKGKLYVGCILLDDDKYNQLSKKLTYYVKRKNDTGYNFKNIFYSLFGKGIHNNKNRLSTVCSSFVDNLFRSIDINLSNKKYNNLVRPSDLRSDDNKVFTLYEDDLISFNYIKIRDKLAELYNDENCNYFNR